MITILRGADSPYQIVTDSRREEEDEKYAENGEEVEEQEIINHFKSHFKNQSFDEVTLSIELPEKWKEKDVEVITQSKTVKIQPGKNLNIHFFVKFPQNVVPTGSEKIELNFRDLKNKRIFTKELKLVGPRNI